MLTRAVLENEPELEKRIRSFDTVLLELLRDVGRGVMSDVTNELSVKQEEKHRADGFTVEKRMDTPFLPSSDK
jgi:hypothetical protein